MKDITIKSIPWVVQMKKECFDSRSIPGVNYNYSSFKDFSDNVAFISFEIDVEYAGLIVITNEDFQFHEYQKPVFKDNFYFGPNSGEVRGNAKEFIEKMMEIQEKLKKVQYNFVI